MILTFFPPFSSSVSLAKCKICFGVTLHATDALKSEQPDYYKAVVQEPVMLLNRVNYDQNCPRASL